MTSYDEEKIKRRLREAEDSRDRLLHQLMEEVKKIDEYKLFLESIEVKKSPKKAKGGLNFDERNV